MSDEQEIHDYFAALMAEEERQQAEFTDQFKREFRAQNGYDYPEVLDDSDEDDDAGDYSTDPDDPYYGFTPWPRTPGSLPVPGTPIELVKRGPLTTELFSFTKKIKGQDLWAWDDEDWADALGYRLGHKSEDLDARGAMVTHVAYSGAFPDAYPKSIRGLVWYELVPEPGNPRDPHAIGLDLNGRRAGYLKATIAYQMQYMIRSLNARGFSCFTPGHIGAGADNRWIAMPVIQALEQLSEADEHILWRIARIVNQFPEDLRDQIREDHWHPSQATTARMWAYRHLAPELFPLQPRHNAWPRSWDKVLGSLRRGEEERLQVERAAERAAERERKRAERERKRMERERAHAEARALREAERAESARRAEEARRLMAERDLEVVALHDAGTSKAEISRQLGISAKTVTAALRRGRAQLDDGGTPA